LRFFVIALRVFLFRYIISDAAEFVSNVVGANNPHDGTQITTRVVVAQIAGEFDQALGPHFYGGHDITTRVSIHASRSL
jgi:hypothetical protein